MKERELKSQILKFLKSKKVFVWNNRNVGIWKPNGGYIPATMKGISDILGILPDGKFLAIEVKIGKNQPTEEQVNFLEAIIFNGGLAILAYSVEDVVYELEKHGYTWTLEDNDGIKKTVRSFTASIG